nr:MAG TPA: JmjC domain-containing histone demethylation protein LYSINE DEMETHYLASE, TANDEM HYBRID [Caudoviricetes sp.]
MKDGDVVRWYLNTHQYITGVIVEECGDGTYWVEHSNGQQRHYRESELLPDINRALGD